jgi:hypothetical protein
MLVSNYAFEMPLTELRTAELLLVTTLRLYAASWREPDRFKWQSGLSAAGLDGEPADAFSDFFATVTATARRRLDVGCTHCQILSPDEGLFLQLVASLQRRRIREAITILDDWIITDAPSHGLALIGTFAEAMARSGLIIPPRIAAFCAPATLNQSGLALLH